MALKNISLFLDFPSECRFPQNPSSRRMQFFFKFRTVPECLRRRLAILAPKTPRRYGLPSETPRSSFRSPRPALVAGQWTAPPAPPCSPCRNAHAPRRSRSGRTIRLTRLLQLDCRSASTFQRGRSENGGHGLFQHLVDLLAVRALFVGCVARPELPVDRRGEFGQRRGQPP